MHQDAEVARRQLHLLALFEIAVGCKPQLQLRLCRDILFQYDMPWRFLIRRLFLLLLRRLGRCCGAEFENFAALRRRMTSRRVPQTGDVAVALDALKQQSADVGSALLLRNEDAEHLDGAGEGHIKQVDVIDVRIDQLPIILLREE